MASGYHYHSDDNTPDDLRKPRNRNKHTTSDTGHARSARYSRRGRNTSAPHPEDRKSAASTIGKIALGVVLVQVVSTCFSMWMNKQDEQKYKVRDREDRRREFERAKIKRRRDEERYEREEEDRERKEASRWEREEIITEGRRIGFVESASVDSNEDEQRAPRQIEATPGWDRNDDRGISVGNRARSRSDDRRSISGRSPRGKSTAGRGEAREARQAETARRQHWGNHTRPPIDGD